MKRKVLGFGIIGCGTISNWHANAVLRVKGIQLTGVTDVNKEAREEFSKKFGTRVYVSVEDMMTDENIDDVCICTQSGLHAPLAIMTANAGKHVITEKPMAISLEEADSMINASKKNNVKMAVISQLRFSDAVLRLKDAVSGSLLGRLVTSDVYMKYYRLQGLGHHPDM